MSSPSHLDSGLTRAAQVARVFLLAFVGTAVRIVQSALRCTPGAFDEPPCPHRSFRVKNRLKSAPDLFRLLHSSI